MTEQEKQEQARIRQYHYEYAIKAIEHNNVKNAQLKKKIAELYFGTYARKPINMSQISTITGLSFDNVNDEIMQIQDLMFFYDDNENTGINDIERVCVFDENNSLIGLKQCDFIKKSTKRIDDKHYVDTYTIKFKNNNITIFQYDSIYGWDQHVDFIINDIKNLIKSSNNAQ